jgi:hypothetical protein
MKWMTVRYGGIQEFQLIQHFQNMKYAHQLREGGGGGELPKNEIFPDAFQKPSTSFCCSPSSKDDCTDQEFDDGTMLF